MTYFYFKENLPLCCENYHFLNDKLEEVNANVRFGPAFLQEENGKYGEEIDFNRTGLYAPQTERERLRGGTISLESALAIYRQQRRRG
jgi:hypothetical protein